MNKRIKKKREKKQAEVTLENIELGNLVFGNSRGKYPVDRSLEDTFREFLGRVHIDGCGYYLYSNEKFETLRGGFENDVFLVNPYYFGDDSAISREPNFVFKPLGYKLKWYKYPLRDSYANKNLSPSKFKEILEVCIRSIK